MPTDNPSLVTVDESACRRFDAAWQKGRPEPIKSFLPPEDRVGYLETLEELIHIELEFAWKSWEGQSPASTSATVGRPVCVEAYLARFPRLDEAPVILRLLRQEYRVRHRYGDRPSTEEYSRRFPALVVTGREVQEEAQEGAVGTAELPNIPGYQILGFLGRGGMGAVFKARHVSLNRVVALKVILAGSAASGKELARFHTEAEAVARLQHPHIIQIHDVGQHQGRPYLALEFVEGGTLAQKLAGAPQPARQAAQLVECLARAIHVAHQRGIVHRDLKPANILLPSVVRSPLSVAKEQEALVRDHGLRTTDYGLPKITDFGLAKLLDSQSGQTTTGVPMGTPSYMAPEQAVGRMKEIGPATDTYALGAILYELLTGRPPFRGETALSTMEQVRSQDAVPPSQLHQKVPRDLETICLKCLEKQPRKRYATAEELAWDLRRFLDGEPIRARPTPAWERGIKWARRRPALAALLGVSGVAAVTVLAVVVVNNARLQEQRDYAEDRRKEAVANFKKARDAVDRLTELARNRLPDVPQTETLRRDLLMDVVKFYEDFAQEKSNDPEVLLETGRAYRRLGEIYELLGEWHRVEQAYQKAFEVEEQVVNHFPDLVAARRELALSHLRLGAVQATARRYQEAEQHYRQALTMQERLVAQSPDDRDYRDDLAVTHNHLGLTFEETKRLSEAEKAYRRYLELMEQLAARFPSEPRYPTHVALAKNNVGCLLEANGHLAEAEETFRQSLELWEDLAARYPAVGNYRAKVCLTLQNLASIWAKTNRAQEAEQALRRTWDLRIQLAKDAPHAPFGQSRLADSLRPLADLVAKRGDLSEAKRLFEMAVSHRERARKMAPQDLRYLPWLREDYAALADLLLQIQDHAHAAKVAAEIPPLFPNAPAELVDSARLLARCVPLAAKDAKLSESKRKELAQTYADRAVQLLREAMRRGYKDTDFLRKSPDFESLRPREDFEALLGQMSAGKESGID